MGGVTSPTAARREGQTIAVPDPNSTAPASPVTRRTTGPAVALASSACPSPCLIQVETFRTQSDFRHGLLKPSWSLLLPRGLQLRPGDMPNGDRFFQGIGYKWVRCDGLHDGQSKIE